MKRHTRRKVLRSGTSGIAVSGFISTVGGTKSGNANSNGEYKRAIKEAKRRFRETGRFDDFQKVIEQSNVSSSGLEIQGELPTQGRNDDVGIQRHRKDKMDIKFYIYGWDRICAADHYDEPVAPKNPDTWDVFFFFEHNPPWWSVGGANPKDVFAISFASQNWYIPSDPRLDTSSRVSRRKETPTGAVFEYSDVSWGNNEQFAQIQVKPDDDDVMPDARQVFATYSHHWSGIDVENVSISSTGEVTVTVSNSEKQWMLYNDPDTGDPLKRSVHDFLDC